MLYPIGLSPSLLCVGGIIVVITNTKGCYVLHFLNVSRASLNEHNFIYNLDCSQVCTLDILLEACDYI